MNKAYLEGIEVYLTSESYISKYSFLNNKSIEYHTKYKRRPIYCGFFRASNGNIINAYINAVYNIIII